MDDREEKYLRSAAIRELIVTLLTEHWILSTKLNDNQRWICFYMCQLSMILLRRNSLQIFLDYPSITLKQRPSLRISINESQMFAVLLFHLPINSRPVLIFPALVLARSIFIRFPLKISHGRKWMEKSRMIAMRDALSGRSPELLSVEARDK